jgi:signal transduction histidine kinase
VARPRASDQHLRGDGLLPQYNQDPHQHHIEDTRTRLGYDLPDRFLVLPVYSIVVTHEIRKRRRVEQALLRAKEEAERASKFKDRSLSTMSHELRTPLNAVLGFSDLLADKRYGDLNERQQRYVGHIHTGGKHLLKLISDILDLSKIEAGRMELSFEDLSVLHIVGEVVSALRPLAEKKSQILSHSAQPTLMVHADATRLKQVLMNLVGNAIKFTPDGGQIELAAQKADGTVEVKVRDNGPGIPEEEQKRIFEAFYRLRNSGAAVEGTGLGLAITERLVKLQRGTLALESELDQGSCFHFPPTPGSREKTPPYGLEGHTQEEQLAKDPGDRRRYDHRASHRNAA